MSITDPFLALQAELDYSHSRGYRRVEVETVIIEDVMSKIKDLEAKLADMGKHYDSMVLENAGLFISKNKAEKRLAEANGALDKVRKLIRDNYGNIQATHVALNKWDDWHKHKQLNE